MELPTQSIDPRLTKPHFSTKVYQSYFAYINKRHPGVDLRQICAQAGLPFEYIKNESNWVSVIFDARLTKLMIEATGEKRLCYLAGEQTLSEEVVGRPVFLALKYSLSLRFIYEELSRLTSLFSQVTEVKVIKSIRHHITLRFRGISTLLDPEEKQVFQESFDSIFQNTLAHYTAIPTCQGMPPAHIEYSKSVDGYGQVEYQMHIRYYDSANSLRTILFLISPVAAIVATGLAVKIPGVTRALAYSAGFHVFTLVFFLAVILKYINLRKGIDLCVDGLQKLDQRYADLHNAKEELENQSESFGRFVPREFLNLLHRKNIVDVRLGDSVEADMTILFCDIRNFTSLSEKMTPQENFRFLNSYLQRVSPVIRKYGGFIDRYTGDGFMAIFPTSARQALMASIDITAQILIYNENRKTAGYGPITVGIGLNTGRIVMGTIGNAEQMQGTVISDCVNTASRLEQFTKEVGATLLISQETFEQSGHLPGIRHRPMGSLNLRGRDRPLIAHHIYEGDAEEVRELHEKTQHLFVQAVASAGNHAYAEAEALFQQILRINPNDGGAKYHLANIEKILKSVPAQKAA